MGEVAKDVMDPRTGKPVFDEARRRAVLAEPEENRKAAEADPSLRIAPLGSGSDFTPFLQHLTMSALNVGFGGESPGGVYHSAYDTIKWYQTYSDTDYSYGRTLSQLTGTLVLRLADAPVLPFQFTDTADTLLRYVVELEKLAESKKDSKVDMKPVRAAVEALKAAGQSFEKAYASVGKANTQALLAKKELQQLNKLLLTSEQKLGNSDGLPRRDWFKHQIYAPGFYTGYGVKTMPQIREGLEEGRFTEAQGGVRTVSAAVNALAAQVNEAAKALEQAVEKAHAKSACNAGGEVDRALVAVRRGRRSWFRLSRAGCSPAPRAVTRRTRSCSTQSRAGVAASDRGERIQFRAAHAEVRPEEVSESAGLDPQCAGGREAAGEGASGVLRLLRLAFVGARPLDARAAVATVPDAA